LEPVYKIYRHLWKRINTRTRYTCRGYLYIQGYTNHLRWWNSRNLRRSHTSKNWTL